MNKRLKKKLYNVCIRESFHTELKATPAAEISGMLYEINVAIVS